VLCKSFSTPNTWDCKKITAMTTTCEIDVYPTCSVYLSVSKAEKEALNLEEGRGDRGEEEKGEEKRRGMGRGERGKEWMEQWRGKGRGGEKERRGRGKKRRKERRE
jgi:hypothetical protein